MIKFVLFAILLTGLVQNLPLEHEELTSSPPSSDTSNGVVDLTKTSSEVIETSTKSSNNSSNNKEKAENKPGIISNENNSPGSSSSVATTEEKSSVNSPSNLPASTSTTDAINNQSEIWENIASFENDTFNNETIGGNDPSATKKYINSKHVFWKDDFVLSIIAPVGIGLGAALFILCVIYCCRCSTKKLCGFGRNRMRMYNSNIRNDVRQMKYKDRIKLLAASSDDEF